jgi:tetratricopeptide (TPR) repeat protein
MAKRASTGMPRDDQVAPTRVRAEAAMRVRPLVIAAVALAVLASSLYKFQAFRTNPSFTSPDDTGVFWSESAFHYRYARMIASGEPVPALDVAAEWPRGVAPHSEFTMGMEYAAGLSYRALAPLFGGPPFHVFLAGFISFWSSLSIAAAFVAARALWRSDAAGLVALAAYALAPAAASRTIWNFVREDFSLPLLFFSFGLFVTAWRMGESAELSEDGRRASRASLTSRRMWCSAGAAIMLALGLSTWHLARFYLLAFAGFVSVTIAITARTRSEVRTAHEERGLDPHPLRLPLTAMTLALLAFGLVVPVLRAKRLFLSPGFLVLAGVAAALLLARGEGARARPRALRWRLAIACAVAIAISRLAPGAEGEYAHVTGLVAAKLSFLGQKPDDPAALSDDARVFWVGPFNAPNVATTLLSFSTILLWAPLGIASAALAAARRRLDPPLFLSLLLVIFFAASFLMIERLVVFLVFFAALLVPAIALAVPPPRRRAVFALLGILALYEAYYLREFASPNPWRRWVEARFGSGPVEAVASQGENARLVAWIRLRLPSDAAILSWFPTGPMILTDTGRPIVLHSMFESSSLRAKERRMRDALFADETALRALCDDFEADYFLYQANLILDTTKESYRYMADRMSASTDCAAFLMHFAPERLTRFALVYQDSYYRLFRVVRDEGPAGAATAIPAPSLPYEEIFDARRLGEAGGRYPDDRSARVIAARDARFDAVRRALALEEAGQRPEAERLYREVLARSPDDAIAQLRLATLALEGKRFDEASAMIERAIHTYPHYAELHYARGLLHEARGEAAAAAESYRAALAILPHAEAVRQRLAFIAPETAR